MIFVPPHTQTIPWENNLQTKSRYQKGVSAVMPLKNHFLFFKEHFLGQFLKEHKTPIV